jgi:hypothetical protein
LYSDRWSPRLRQGDIIGPIPLPLMGMEVAVGFQSRSLVAPTPGDAELSVTIPAAKVMATVISHDCEFNEGKRNKLLVARLQGVQRNLSAEEREALRASNDVQARSDAGLDIAGVDAFLFSPLAGVFEDEQVANFATITPLPMKMAGDLLDQRRAELDQETRVLFRLKLAWFVGRAADDIPDDEKVDPPTPGVPRSDGA